MKNIKLIVFDVDGVLTDGKLYIGSDGHEYKAFHTQDGMGISLAHYAGIKTAIITGRTSEAVAKRAKELKINYVFQGIHHKLEVLQQMISEMKISLDEVCYVGDDINDLPILKVCGFGAVPNNAVPLVREQVQFVSQHNGGEGAVRDIIEHILQQSNEYPTLIEDFLNGKVRVIQ
ncbi:KdsC family phosphatase [Neobacillus cucumis]|uniref:3-deoxy-D-manno-octulosonate 8-phosphate phosphatase n=1 Tax=Neobacillus cucumis TaxID=1740721 RepID=A0A2N5H7J5_9BACI|nr:HAD-IIIA family hydrolase [Neobacillus cucumis]PLS01494.1 3-deoxy-D-manno-octulosonate 8-phosphate phosphatase [Neobacillus cucumis]